MSGRFFGVCSVEIKDRVLVVLARSSHSLPIVQEGGIELVSVRGTGTVTIARSGAIELEARLFHRLSVLKTELLLDRLQL